MIAPFLISIGGIACTRPHGGKPTPGIQSALTHHDRSQKASTSSVFLSRYLIEQGTELVTFMRYPNDAGALRVKMAWMLPMQVRSAGSPLIILLH